MQFLISLLICSKVFVVLTTASAFILPGVTETEKFKDGKVKFHLWNNYTKEQEVRIDNYGNITTGQIKFLIHGYLDGGTGKTFMLFGPMVQTFLKTGANVIYVDWSYYSRRMYHESAVWLKYVAELIARFITRLKEKEQIPFTNIHVLGHSLGAHMSGFVGKYIQQKNNGEKLDRITGLDPAGHHFHTKPNTDRLYKTDATKVDTIITDIILLGMNQSLGQVNFYVWCGANPILIPVNHCLAPYYYTYGILNTGLIGKECICQHKIMKDCKSEPTNNLGEAVDFKKPGTYYLNIDVASVMRYALKAAKKTVVKSNLDALVKQVFEILNVQN